MQNHLEKDEKMHTIKILAKNLKILRGELKMSQEDLAEATGLHRTYISGLERGVRNPTVKILEKLARALKTNPSSLLSERKQ